MFREKSINDLYEIYKYKIKNSKTFYASILFPDEKFNKKYFYLSNFIATSIDSSDSQKITFKNNNTLKTVSVNYFWFKGEIKNLAIYKEDNNYYFIDIFEEDKPKFEIAIYRIFKLELSETDFNKLEFLLNI